jgi:hypothetical protein
MTQQSTVRGRPANPGAGVVWARVEDGFHVGSRNGFLLGYITRRKDGRCAAWDMRSHPVGLYADLPSAMSALARAFPNIGR